MFASCTCGMSDGRSTRISMIFRFVGLSSTFLALSLPITLLAMPEVVSSYSSDYGEEGSLVWCRG
jgi:hypothetical protein